MQTTTLIQILITMFITFLLIILVASGEKLGKKKEPTYTAPTQAEASINATELPN